MKTHKEFQLFHKNNDSAFMNKCIDRFPHWRNFLNYFEERERTSLLQRGNSISFSKQLFEIDKSSIEYEISMFIINALVTHNYEIQIVKRKLSLDNQTLLKWFIVWVD